ncbi:putative ribonuclease H-like domain-containing protein [Tanacetum coccineum]
MVDAMQEELLNKKDERGVLVRNKARIKAIGIFLALASYMGFIVCQMDVKSSFLYGIIDEGVYVSQPLDPRAWYATLSTFLLKSGYRRGTIDKTLFIKKNKNDIMLVQVYVDDIIFSSTKRSWCDEFEALIKCRFQMSSMGELTFFLGLQVKQKEDGIFISQDKYVAEILKKFDFASMKTANTPIETQKSLTKDEEAADVDVHLYRSMIGSLMYLTASRPDIMYLKGKPKLGLWYLIVSSFDLEAYSDSDYAGANLDSKSTTGGCQFLGRRLISWQCKKQIIVATSTTEAEYVVAANCCGQNPVFHSKTKHIKIRHHFIRDAYEKRLIQVRQDVNDEKQIHATVDSKVVVVTEASIRSSLLLNDVDGTTCLTNESIFQNLALTLYMVKKGVPLLPLSSSSHSSLSPSPFSIHLFLFLPPVLLIILSFFHSSFFLLPLSSFLLSFLLLSYYSRATHPSEVHVEPQSNPSPRPSSTTHIPDSILEDSGGNHGGQSSSDRSLFGNEGDMTLQSIKKPKKKAKPVIAHHNAWMKSVTLKQRLAGKKSLKKNWMQKESVSKQGRKSAKAEPSVHKDPLFDELDDDEIDNMDTEDAQGMGRTRYVVHEEKERKEKEVSTEDALGTNKQKDSTDKEKVSTDRPDEGTDRSRVSTTDNERNYCSSTVSYESRTREAQEKEKGVELKDVEETKRPRPTSTRSLLTLKPLPKIDPKDNGKKKIEEEDESDTESEGIPEAEKKFKQLARDEKMARKVQEDWEAEEEVKKLAEEEATNAALI